MPSSYPGGLDTLTNPSAGDTLASPSHSGQHANVNDAIEAIEAELGLTPSSGQATVKTRLDSLVFNVKDYGATGDGATDDTAAIQAAIDAADDEGAGIYETGATVFFPSGRYKITSPLTPAGCVLYKGAGREATNIYCVGTSGFVFTTGDFNEPQWLMTFEDMTIRGDYTAAKHGFDMEFTHQIHWNRVYVRQFGSHGITLNNCLANEINGCYLRDNDGSGLFLGPISGPTVVVGSRIRLNNGWGIEIAGGSSEYVTGVTLLNTEIERNLEGGLSIDYARNINVVGGHYEVNHQVNTDPGGRGSFSEPAVGVAIQIGANSTDPVTGVTITGVNFGDGLPTSNEGYQIDLDRVDGVVISGCTLDYATKAIKNDSGDNANVRVFGNSYGSSLTNPEDNGIIRGRAKDASVTYLGLPGQMFHSVTTFALVADVTYYEAVFLQQAVTLDRLNIGVVTPASAGKIARLAIYCADTDWQPTSLVIDAGNVATDAVQQSSATISTKLMPGRYLFAINANEAVTLRALLAPAHAGNNIASATCLLTSWSKTATIATYPDPGTDWDNADFVSIGHRCLVLPRVSAFVDEG